MFCGERLIQITAWLAFAAWFVALAMNRGARSTRVERLSSFIGLSGSVLMLVHVSFAFDIRHDWSHAAAVVETARQTEELMGVNWGVGVWWNYVFSIIWMSDGLWRVVQPPSYESRPRWLSRMIHFFLAFMWFNATVLFGSREIQIAGVGVFGWLVICLWTERRRRLRTKSVR